MEQLSLVEVPIEVFHRDESQSPTAMLPFPSSLEKLLKLSLV